MAHDLDTVPIADDSELARLLDCLGTGKVRFERNGVVYRVTREDWTEGEYDPAKVRAAVEAAAGLLMPEEGGALRAYIRRGREEGSRPLDRPGISPSTPDWLIESTFTQGGDG